MAQSLEDSLLLAIKKDDRKAFYALTEKTRCGAIRLGRFPVLSLMYLYRSRRLLSDYEESFLKITNFAPLREPVEISKKFSARAGKCFRLYLNETVSPLEMLLILDQTKRLKRVYPAAKPSAEVRERLKSIYAIRYSLNVKFEGDGIVIDRRPLSYREKKNIAVFCLCSVLAVTVAVGVPVTTVSLIPKPVEGEVTKLSQIDFGSQETYTLKRDIVLPENYSVEEVNCTIAGEGNKLIFGRGASLGGLNGKISDLTIESEGDAVFTSVSENAAIENVTVNVCADVTAAEASAFVAETNYGKIDGVTVNVTGSIHALAASDVTGDFSFGGIVQSNGSKYSAATQTIYLGVIQNCTVNYSQFTLVGESAANAAFGGVTGTNGGYVLDCTVTGKIVSDTFDIAGVCLVNNGLLSGSVNEADLAQTSADTGWNPITCGIVLSNAYAVENCVNRGSVSSESACGQFETDGQNETIASAAGIAYLNRGTTSAPYLINCTNYGSVDCSAAYRDAYAAGVCISSSGGIEKCVNSGALTARAENGCGVYAGGITALAYGNITRSVNAGSVTTAGNGTAYAGGISALVCAQIYNCYSSGDLTVTAQDICAGGIFGFSDVIRSGFYIYFGAADSCIGECKISVAAAGGTPACVGGIGGYVSEAGFNSGDVQYIGGCITNCFFTGACTSEITYFGNIAGVCGANVYENNSFTSGGAEYHNFADNVYLSNSYSAFGAAAADGKFVSAEDKGAASAELGEIRNSEAYQTILSALEDE